MVDVTIIIPAYNVEKYIYRGIESCINQTHFNIEIIIVDDGSKDKTWDIMQKYAKLDNRVKIFHQSNKGVSSARNLAIDKANGKYIIFLDSDDWLELNAIEILLKNLGKKEVLLCCGAFFADIKGLRESTSRGRQEIEVDRNNALLSIRTNAFRLQSACYKVFDRKIIQRNGIRFNEEISNGEDGLFSFQYICKTEGLKYIPIDLWNILDRPNSATTSKYCVKMNSALKAIKLMMKQKEITEDIKKALECYYCDRVFGLLITSIKDRVYYKNNFEYLKRELSRYIDTYKKSEISVKRKIQFVFLENIPYSILKLVFRK